MKTEAAENLIQHILDTAKRLNDTAKMYAVQYAENDDPKDKERFDRYKFAAEEIHKLHQPACKSLHALEAMIPAKAEGASE
jgi:methylase of polypeptide subunit release factors